jgi:hypothetical protein
VHVIWVDGRIARPEGRIVMKRLVPIRRIVVAAVAALLLAVVGATVAAADDGSSWTAPALGPSGDGMTWG